MVKWHNRIIQRFASRALIPSLLPLADHKSEMPEQRSGGVYYIYHIWWIHTIYVTIGINYIYFRCVGHRSDMPMEKPPIAEKFSPRTRDVGGEVVYAAGGVR